VKIARIRTLRLATSLDPPFYAAWDPVPRTAFEATLVFVETDEGVTGIGSGDVMDGFERYEHLFVGEDVLAIDRHVRVLETITFHAGRYWPVEAALWDLAGKAEGRATAAILGGPADGRLPAYASCGELKRAGERAESALALREKGFRALKLRIERGRVEDGVAAVAAVRDAVGDSMEIAVDLNQAWRMPGDLSTPLDRDAVLRLASELAELGIMWLEEPLPGEDVHGLAALRRQSGLRIAGGEMARTIHELGAYLAADALDVYQPDAVLAVGITRGLEIARRAHAEGRWFTPHTWTNGIGLVANLHMSAAAEAGPYVEFPYDPPGWTEERRDFMLAEPTRVDPDGCVAVPAGPGLGIELDDDALRRYVVT
jgi:D-galactarolactone cycloisomerase